MKSVAELQELAARVVDTAMKQGADVAEVIASSSNELTAKVRLKELERIEEAGSHTVGLRVIREGRAATAYTTHTTPEGLEVLLADVLELATLSEPDELALPPHADELAAEVDAAALELFDPAMAEVDAAAAIELATRVERAAQEADARVTNSEGASCQRSLASRALVTSGGFAGGYRTSLCSLYASPVADDADGKKRTAYDWDVRRFMSDLRAPEDIGGEAARRTVAKLGARKVATCEAPVVFHPDAGRALLSLLFSCVEGRAVYQRASFLCDQEGKTVASDLVDIVDDARIGKGPGSLPFDGEGLLARTNEVITGGVLRSYLLDTYSGRKLGRRSTANGSRGYGGRISVAPTNFLLKAGTQSKDDVVAGVERGLYVTSMMGFGFSPVTGDFSRGAEGFWIEDGKLSHPVGEITISLGFKELWPRVDAIADDLDLKSRYACPTFRVSRMTIAGS